MLPYGGHRPVVEASAFIAPGAAIIGDVTIGREASIWYQCVVRGDLHWIRIGARSNIQDGSVVHVQAERWPVRIGEQVTVGHRAVLHGCTVEDLCLIGMGAVVLDGAVIGHGAVVAAGAVVAEGTHVAAGSLVAGVPARFKRRLDDAMLADLRRAAADYVELGRAHAAALAAQGED